jgi:hypothetical protein
MEPVPILVLPSSNVTVPSAEVGFTFAVRLTACPKATVAGAAFSVTVVACRGVVAAVIVTVTAAEVDGESAASPPYDAVNVCNPTLNVLSERIAEPELSVEEPTLVPPSMNVTVPVAEAGVTVAVKLTACPATALVGVAARVTVVVCREEAFTCIVRAPETEEVSVELPA